MAQAAQEERRGLTALVAALAVPLAAACLAFPSVHGPEGLPEVALPTALLGTWVEVDGDREGRLEVGPRSARAIVEEPDGPVLTEFELRPFELDGTLLVELSLSKPEREAVAKRYGAFLLPLRVFVRIVRDGERAVLSVPDPDWVRAGGDLTDVRLSGGDTGRIWTLDPTRVEARLRAAVHEAPWRTVLELQRRP